MRRPSIRPSPKCLWMSKSIFAQSMGSMPIPPPIPVSACGVVCTRGHAQRIQSEFIAMLVSGKIRSFCTRSRRPTTPLCIEDDQYFYSPQECLETLMLQVYRRPMRVSGWARWTRWTVQGVHPASMSKVIASLLFQVRTCHF